MSNIELIDIMAEHAYERKARIDVDRMLAYLAEYMRRSKDKSHDPSTTKPMNDNELDEQDIAIIQCVADVVLCAHSPLSEQEESHAANRLQLRYVQFLKRALSNHPKGEAK